MSNADEKAWPHEVHPQRETPHDVPSEQALRDELEGSGRVPHETRHADLLAKSQRSHAPQVHPALEPVGTPAPEPDETPVVDPIQQEPPGNVEPVADTPPTATDPVVADTEEAQPVEPPQRPSPWSRPVALIDQIKGLRAGLPVPTWSRSVLDELARLTEFDTLASPEVVDYLDRLAVLADDADRRADELPDRSEQIALRQAAYSLRRRLDVWSAVHTAVQAPQAALPREVYTSVRGETMLVKIADVRKTLTGFDAAADWEQYLLLNQLEQAARGQGDFPGAARVELAQLALERFHDPNLSEQQQAVLEMPPVVELDQELRLWATHPVSHADLLAALERFEQHATHATASELAASWRDLRWSALPAQQQVAEALDLHYRNANIRCAVSEEMINRLVPAVSEISQPVRDRVLGAQVKGLSNTRSRVLVNLLPDRSRLRLMFEASGVTAARTAATKGPVTIFSRNQSNYRVRKIVLMDSTGPRLERSQAVASGDTNLLGMRTNYDHLPFLGTWVRNLARQRHQEQTGLVRRILTNRVKNEARMQIDKEIESELAQARNRLDKRLIQPLRQLDLQPRAMEMKTLENRMVLRGRLAANHQLAAYTARPRAHSDNHLSMQIHESALNNFVEQLGLDGREADLRELYQELSEKLRSEPVAVPEDIPEGVRLRFADKGAVRIDCDEGAVTVTLSIAELSGDDRTWRNFEVQADYRIQQGDGSGVDLYFARDGGIRLSRTRRNFALRAIFTKVFSSNNKIQLVNPELAQDERLADLRVTQMQIVDGWIGLSIGQNPQSLSVARPETTRR